VYFGGFKEIVDHAGWHARQHSVPTLSQ